jgi:CheY-like chemotaxis protein
MRVLVVDDAEAVRYTVRLLLEDAAMEVEVAASGSEALARLIDPRGLDAVVLDERMPDLSGLVVARLDTLRAHCPQVDLYPGYLSSQQTAAARGLGVATVIKGDLSKLIETLRALHCDAKSSHSRFT